MSIKIGSYKGHSTISLDAENKYPFTFGVAKAKLILANLDAIKRFVAANTPAGSVDPMGIDRQYEDNCASTCGLNGGAQ